MSQGNKVSVRRSEKARAQAIVETLADAYPDAACTLDHTSVYALLCGAILATQCTDKRVNAVLPAFLTAYPDPHTLAQATCREVEPYIASCGLYKNKAKALVGSAQAIVNDHAGQVPEAMDALLALPGVGRKIANLIRGDGYGHPGLVVDTHCGRLARRLGLATKHDPTGVERELCAVVAEKDWTRFGHLMVTHGRAVCKARAPLCETCVIRTLCPRVDL